MECGIGLKIEEWGLDRLRNSDCGLRKDRVSRLGIAEGLLSYKLTIFNLQCQREKWKLKVIIKILLCCIFTVSLCSCSVRKMIINEVAGIVGNGISAFEQDDDLDMLEKAFPGNIKLIEAFLENSPDNYRLLVLLSRFYASYTFIFFEGKWEEATLKGYVPNKEKPDEKTSDQGNVRLAALKETVNRYYLKGADYAMRALEVNHGQSRDQLKKVASQNWFFEKLTKDDVPALFWYGFNTGAYVNLNRDSIKAISKAHLAEKAMKRVLELDPAYYHGGAHLFLLAYYASRSPMMGGNPEVALSHYKKLKDLTGDSFLLADLYYARFYLYQKQERKKFKEVMTGIVQYSKTRKTYLLYNKVAADRAKVYLEVMDQLFD